MRYPWDSSWYRPGDWGLPGWWTSMPPGRKGGLTNAEQEVFYTSWFMREVLGHTGGLRTLPGETK